MKLLYAVLVVACVGAPCTAQSQGSQPLSTMCRLTGVLFEGQERDLAPVGFPPSPVGSPCSYGSLKGTVVGKATTGQPTTGQPCSRTPDGRGIVGDCTAADMNPTRPDFSRRLPPEFSGPDLLTVLREGMAKRCIREFGFDKGYECTVRSLAHSYVSVDDQQRQDCQQKHPNEGIDALNCIIALGIRAEMEPNARAITDCLSGSRTESERARCLANRLPSIATSSAAGMVRCVRDESSLEEALRCSAANAAAQSTNSDIRSAGVCIRNGMSASEMASCISSRVANANPDVAAVVNCLQRTGTDSDRSRCILDRVVAGADQNVKDAATCLRQSTLTGALTCAALTGAERSGFRETAMAASCFRKNGVGEKGFSCLAEQLAEKNVGRDTLTGVRCVSQHGVSTKAAMCGVIDKLSLSVNNEASMAIDCVTKFGPTKAAVVCAAVGLTVAEFEKCLSSGGADCFGPNNDLRRFVEDQMNAAHREANPVTAMTRFVTGVSLRDIERHGPLGGENSEFRKACDRVLGFLGGRC
jgi:hypothetical protein